MTKEEIERIAANAGGQEYGPRTWNMTFKQDALHTFAQELIFTDRQRRASDIERLADSGSEIRLHCGEMTAQEMRTAKAVLRWAASVVRRER